MKRSLILIFLFLTGCSDLIKPLVDGPSSQSSNPVEAKNQAFVSMVEKSSGVSSSIFQHDQSDYDDNVRALIKWSTMLLGSSDQARKKFYSQNINAIPFFFRAFLQKSGPDKFSAFCQQTALSALDVLGAYGIKGGTIIWTQNGVGMHTFLYYINPYTGQEGVVDPYYEIYYAVGSHLTSRADLISKRVSVEQSAVNFIPWFDIGPDQEDRHFGQALIIGLQAMWNDGTHIQ